MLSKLLQAPVSKYYHSPNAVKAFFGSFYSVAWPLIWMWRLADIQWALSLFLDGYLCAWKGNPILPILVGMLFVSRWFYLSPVRGGLCQRSRTQTVLHTKLHICPVLVIRFALLHPEFSFSLSEVWLWP